MELSVLKFAMICYCVIKFLDVVKQTTLQSKIDELDDDTYKIEDIGDNV